ncbi:MAG: hypothetical protein ABDH28_03640 [Brevinematia bacterium]
MGLLDKARSYREKLIISSLKGENDLFSKKPVTVEDLKILKDLYERTTSTQIATAKLSLLNLLVKVVEDVRYLSSVEGLVSSLYTLLSRIGYDVEGIGYMMEKFDVIYGDLEENEIPVMLGVDYYSAEDGKFFFKVGGEMGTFLVAKCKGKVNLDEDTEMIVKKCIDILSVALRLIQFKGLDIQRFWGYRNSFLLSQIYSLANDDRLDENDRVTMLAYCIKELFGLNFVIFFEEKGGNLKPKFALDFPVSVLVSLKLTSDLLGKNINSLEVVDLELSKLFSYGSRNVAFTKLRGRTICVGANYDLSFVISMISGL